MLEALADDLRVHRARVLAQQHAHHMLVAAFAKRALRATFVKGLAFQLAVGLAPQGRASRDLDLWVDDLPNVVRVLRELGWEGAPSRTTQSTFRRRGVTLDVHLALFAPRYALGSVEPELRARLSADGAMPLVAHAWLAGLHAAKDGWSTLRHLADLRSALRALDDPSELADLADRTRTRRLMDVGVALTREQLGAVPWQGPPPTSALLNAARRRLAERESADLRSALVYARCRERRRDGLASLVHAALQQSEADAPGPARLARRGIRLWRGLSRL